ncbi:hypothetical protein [Brachybacterium hainanense]|uniref:Uncharacterized protein n=1 Tax=Brachybacterium hainanense TaxID=1541174 RepID=A0ABV6RBE9_9MICO
MLNPGMWSQNHLEAEDYGFPAEEERRSRPRLRLGVTITVTALGFLLAAATALLFVRLADFAVHDLPARAPTGWISAAAPVLPAGEAPPSAAPEALAGSAASR